MVARSTWDGAMTVYRYGCPSWVDLDDVGMEQLLLAHDLRNELVAIEHRYELAVQVVWSLFPEIAETDAEVRAALSVVNGLQERAAAERKADRTTVPRAATLRGLTEARRRLRQAKAAHRQAKQLLYPQAKSRMVDVRRARDAVRKALYSEYCQSRGLYWATYNDVVQAHVTAVTRVTKQRKQGRPAELRFRRWDGSGTVTVQLQRDAGKPARTFELLASGQGPWRNVVRFWPEERPRPRHQEHRRTSRHWEMAFTVGANRHVQIPVVLDRIPDEEADITLVRITRRRVAGHHRLSIALTARISQPEPSTGALVCVHIGWRSLGGDLRVAVVTADRALPAPPAMLPVCGLDHGWEVRLPAELRHAHERTDRLRSQRDKSLKAMRAALAEWLDQHPQPHLPAGQVRHWRSPKRFARLAVAWRKQPPEDGNEIARLLEDWRRQDRHLWEWEANERDQIAARVRDLWDNVAAWLTNQAGLVVFDDTDIIDITRVPEIGTEDPWQARLARAQQWLASPGKLRACVRRAAQTRGVPVETLPAEGITSIHCGCGTALAGEPASQVVLWCPSCGHGVDQDLNAAEHLLVAASARPAPVIADPVEPTTSHADADPEPDDREQTGIRRDAAARASYSRAKVGALPTPTANLPARSEPTPGLGARRVQGGAL